VRRSQNRDALDRMLREALDGKPDAEAPLGKIAA
jgi:hypothetical protein